LTTDFTRALRNEQTQLAQRKLQLGRQSGNPDPLATVANQMPINAERLANPEPTANYLQDQMNSRGLAQQATQSLRWMDDAPENPAMVKDELPQLIDWERTIMRNLDSKEAGNVARGWENGKLMFGTMGAAMGFTGSAADLTASSRMLDNLALAAMAQAAGEPLDYNDLKLEGGHAGRSERRSIERFLAATPEERQRQLTELSLAVLDDEVSAGRYFAKLKELSAEREKVNFTAVQDLRDIRSTGDLMEWGVVQGIPSLGIMAGIIGAGLLTGGVGGVALSVAAGTVAAQGEIVSGQVDKLDSMVMYTPEMRIRARQTALLSGSLEAVLGPVGRVSALGSRTLFNAVTRREALSALSEPVLRRISQGYLRRIGAPFLRDGIEEFVAEGAQTLIEQYGVEGKLELNNETMWAALNGAVLGGLTGGVMGMTIGARGAITDERTARAMADAGQTVHTMDQLAAVTQKLKLNSRSPSKFKALVDRLGLSNTSVYFQTDDIVKHASEIGVSPEVLVERLGGSVADFDAARDSNGRVAVKASGVVTSLAGDSADFIKGNASITAQGFTPAEAKSMKEIQAEIADQAAMLNDLEAMAPKRKSMYSQITSQLKATGRMTAPEVEANAALATAFFETMATRYGIDAQDLFQRMGFDVKGEAQTLGALAGGQKELAAQTKAVAGLQGIVSQLEAAVAAAPPETKAAIEAQLQQAVAELEAAGVGIEELTAAVDAGIAQFQADRTNQAQTPNIGAGRGQRSDTQGRTRSGSLSALEGAPTVRGVSGPDPRLVAVAEKYAADNGIDLKRQAEFVKVDPEFAARVADAYEAMEHNPQDPAVKEAYANLIAQTTAQYQALVDAGYTFYFIDLNSPEGQAYAASPWNAMFDARDNQTMGVFSTAEGFGTGDDFSPDANPLLAETGIEWPLGPNGEMRPVYANDLFRAVHDAFGHGLEFTGFRADGEENAWQAHVRLFTGSAVAAITTETRGQNSWLNYGPNGEANRTAKVEDTVFADQKTGLLPEFAWTENVSPDDTVAADFTVLNQAGAGPIVDTSVAGGLTSKSFIKTRDLEGASIYPMFADLTAAGSTYDKLDGIPLAPTPYLGGPNFPWLKAYRDAGVVWAFNKVGVISKVRNKVRALREQSLAQGGSGRVVITMLAMKDDAHTSNEMTINALLRTLEGVIEAGQFPAGQIQKAHELIVSKSNKKDDGYAGLATLPMLDDAVALHAWIRQATFTTRKAMANEMNSAAFRSLDGMFPVGRVIREAVDPDYRATQQGDALLAMEIDPDAEDLIIDFDDPAQAGDIPRHPAYRYGMRGTLVGSFSTHIPMEVLYKDLLQEVTSRSKEGSNPKFLMERLRTTDEQIVTPEIVREAEVIEQLHDYRVAQAYTAALAGQWRSSDNAANAGGINPAEFELALVENEASATLTKYTAADLKAGKKDGSFRVFQLGDTRVQEGGLNVWMGVKKGLDYRQEYPSDVTNQLVADGILTDNETALVGVASNELGVQGMGTFQVLKAIEEGVTVLDAFKVKSASKPAGLLPSIYATMGFEEVGAIPFDPQYFTNQEIENLKAVWTRQGWLEGDAFPDVAIMKWRGDDAIRSEATKRFVLEGQDGLGIRSGADLDEFKAAQRRLPDGAPAGNEGDGVTGQGDGRANPRRFADRARSVSGRARSFANNVIAADEAATNALKLPKSMIDAIRAQYGEPVAPQGQGQGQGQGQVLNQQNRGQIAMPSNLTEARSVITLFQKSDKSTFVHEAGHFFLQAFKELSMLPTAPADMVADMDTINEFLGRGQGEQSPFTVAQQEQWAVAFEKYIETGKAPSVELRTSFERLRKWIVNLYRQFGGLNVELPPEVTEVMDRMLATDDAIAIAKAEQGMGQMLTAKPPNMTEEVWAAYRKGAIQHDDEAAATLLAKTMEPIRRARSKGYIERRAVLRAEIEASVDADPQRRVLRRLATKDAQRLDRKSILDTYGQEALDDLDKHTEKGRKVYGTGEPSIEAVAHQYGYKNAATMISELREMPSREARIEEELRMKLREEFADALDDGSIKREAMAALHKDKNRQLMMLDLNFILDTIKAEGGEVPTMMTKAEMEARVELEVSETTVRQATQDAVYLHAERTAGRKAQTLMARIMKRMTSKGKPKTTASEDLVAAFKAKENQIIAHMKYNHARDTQAIVDRLIAANKTARNKDVGKRLAEPQIGTLRELLEKYSFRPQSPKQLKQARDLASYVQAMVDAGNEDQLAFNAESVIATGRQKHYSELTVEELQELDAIVKNLIYVGRATRKVLDGITARAYQEVKTDIITELDAKHEDDGPSKVGKRDERLLKKGSRAVRGFFLSMSNADSILRVLDRTKRDAVGLMGRVIAIPVQDAMSRAGLRRRKNAEWFERDLWKKVYGKDYIKQLRTFTSMKVEATVGGTKEILDGYNLLTIALNTGADGNMERLTNQGSRNFMTKKEIERVLSENMTTEMWQVVSQVWGKINELWPDISDLEVQATGVRPQQITTKIQIKGAPAFVKNGGYYPIRYDREQAVGTVRDTDADTQVKNMASGRAARAQTKSGWQEARTAVTGDPLSLQFHGALSHMNDVVYDLELRLPLSGAMKILKDKEISGILTEKGFNQELDHLKLWAEDVANGDRQASDAVSRLVKQLREGTSVAAMAYSWTTLVQQPLGLFNAVNIIGAGNLIKGFSAYMGNVREASDVVMSKSPFMQERQQTMQRDMALASGAMREDTLSGGRIGAFKQGMQAYGFVGMQKLQFYTVDMPTWYGAYGSYMQQGKTDAEAVSYADRMVARAHGSGVISDRSAFERGTVGANTRNSELVRAFTTFQTFIIARLSVTSVEFRNMRMDDPATIMNFATDLAIAYIIPSMFSSLLRLQPWDEREQDDIEEMGIPLWWLTTQLPKEFLGGPIISQAVSSWEGFGAETSFEAGIGTIVGGGKAISQMVSGDFNWDSSTRSVISAAGIVFKLPSVVINRGIKQVLDKDGLSDEELNLLEVLYGKNLTFAE